jgi:predicted DNA-binding transcriptional regulator AlpA
MVKAEERHERKFLTVSQLCARWGVSTMFVERRLRSDPDFPQVYDLGKRKFSEQEISEYERRAVRKRHDVKIK